MRHVRTQNKCSFHKRSQLSDELTINRMIDASSLQVYLEFDVAPSLFIVLIFAVMVS